MQVLRLARRARSLRMTARRRARGLVAASPRTWFLTMLGSLVKAKNGERGIGTKDKFKGSRRSPFTFDRDAAATSGGNDAFGEHLPDAAQCLTGALLVLDEGEADVAVAVFAEADAGADGYFRFLQKVF